MLRRNLKLKTFVIVSIAGVIILAGLLVGTVRLIDLAIPSYRNEVAAIVSERIDRPVAIGAMDMSWSWRGPVLQLNQAAILDSEAKDPIVSLKSLALHFGITDLLRLRLQPNGISIAGPQLSAYRDADGKLRLRGMQTSDSSLDWQDVVQKLEKFEFIRVTDGELLWSPAPDSDNPMRLDSIVLNLVNQDTRYRLNGQLQLPRELGEQAEFSALIINGPNDRVGLDKLRAHTYFKGEKLDLTALAKATGADLTAPKSGRNNLEIWSDWRVGEFSGARVSVTGSPTLESGDGPQGRLLPPMVGMDFSVVPVAEGFRVNLDAVRGQDGYQPKMGGNALVNLEEKTARAQFEDIPASLLGGWLPLFDNGATWQTSGVVKQVNLDYNGQEQPAQVTGEIVFTDLAFSNPERGLQANGLNGTLLLASDGGRLRLSGADGKLAWANYINGELPLGTLAGEIDWRHTDDTGWRILAEKLRWRGADAEITANGDIHIPTKGSPKVDIKAQVQSQDLPRLLAYLPQDPELPNPRLRDWLAKAILAGSMSSGEVVLQGPLDNFPYADGGGTFEVNAKFDNAELDYKPGWPPISDGSATLNLIGKTLKIQADNAKMLGITIGPAVATVPNVQEAVLAVDGSVNDADANKLLSFLSNSPLREKFGKLTQILEIDGRADLALDLSIPLKPDLGEVRSNGRITLKQTTLSHRVLPEPVKNVHGELTFTRQGVSATGLRGDLLGLPLVADLNPGNAGTLSINASTLVRLPRDYDALRRFVPAAVVDQVSGEGVWHATLEVASDGSVSDLALRSDLEGISLGFPAPLHKEADGPLPIRVEVGGERQRIHVDLADRLDMVLRSQNGRVSNMNVIFGDTGEKAPAGEGIWLGGTIVTLDALGWQDFISALGSDGEQVNNGNNAPLALRGADLRIQETLFGGQRMNRVQFQLNPLATGGGWTANITGPGAQGDIRYLSAPPGTSDARGLLNGTFARIELEPDANTRPEGEDETKATPEKPPRDPSQFPVTDIAIDNIKLDGINIGQLNLQARAIPGGLDLTQLVVSGGQLDIDATGQWLRKNNLTEAQLAAQVKGEGLDSLFRTLGYSANIRAQDTDINADLSIAPNPNGLSPAALNGSLKIKFDDGTLISVDPGAGRVLGLFNFYALPRRLLFDFRDVVNEGLAFDSIRGSFSIDSGIASSDNVRIKMPSATLRVKGEVDLAKRTYDQRVTIAPKLSSGVAVAGTVLGGPAVGAILLLAQKLLEKPIENLSAISYHLTGDWQDPEIQTITADEKTPSNEEKAQ